MQGHTGKYKDMFQKTQPVAIYESTHAQARHLSSLMGCMNQELISPQHHILFPSGKASPYKTSAVIKS